ncbi:50S ribosomal protein L32 [Patescibacteria group bacterium]
MGALPKRRISTGRKGRRRSAINLKKPRLNSCPNCGQPKALHQACSHCSYYKGKSIISKKDKKGSKDPSPKKK